MSFVPGQRGPTGTPNVTRTVLFWVLMIALAVVLWQMSPRKKKSAAAPQMNYSQFMSQVDANNVSTAHLYVSPSTAEVRGQLRQPPAEFRVTIPKESIPELTAQLRKQGASIQVSKMRSTGWTNTLIEWVPLVLVLFVWIIVMSRRNRKSQATPPANQANRPIG